MSSFNNIKGKVRQLGSEVSTEATWDYAKLSILGQLFTASWKEKLLMAGKCWVVTAGTIYAGSDIVAFTGGGNGLSIDQDQPEVIIGVDAGYSMIPIEISVATHCDIDATDEEANIIAVADRAAGPPTTVTGTTETPLNLLDGATGFPGRAFSAVTVDITDPTVSEILDCESVRAAAATTGVILKMHYEPVLPSILAGPCALHVYWGGTGAVTGVARVVVAVVDPTWFPTS